MRAVNLMPAEGRAGGLDGGRTGGAVFIVLGGLAMLALLVSVWALTGRRVGEREAQLAGIQGEVAALQAKLQAETAVAADTASVRALRDTRLATVRSLAAARIDWATTMDAVARTLPAHTWLATLSASAAPGAGPGGGAGGAGAIASSSPGPSIQVGGCSPSQAAVARLMPRLRAVPGVERVALASTKKAAPSATRAPGECTGVTFDLVLLMAAAQAAPPAAPATPVAETQP